jgi:FecR protein
MKKHLFRSLCFAGAVLAATTGRAIDLKQSKISQVVNDVQIISAAGQNEKAAAVNDVFSMPDILRTGAASRAELIAADETVTRVGANTIFSFDPANRTINLKQGSLLFHSPHGKGGGTIHTGSATASVLGTTLIVTTTPDGGMKVLDLEGSVEVKFLNNLKQKLSSGQMTFILPGGKTLAPIIIFRLDELVKESLLVKGFGHPLASLPLILQQINEQLKLIKTGRARDTGLLVGDKATGDAVQVFDFNSIQNHVFNNAVQTALHTDADITGSSVTDPAIPTPPQRIFFNQPITLANNSFYAGQTFQGFAGDNISFNSADPLSVSLANYSGNPEFDFVAAGKMNFNTSVTFTGLGDKNRLLLVGGTGMNFAPNTTLEADVASFGLSSAGAISLDGGGLINRTGDIAVDSGSTISINNAQIFTPGQLSLTAKDGISIAWDASVWLTGNNKFETTAANGSVDLSSVNGALTVQHTSIKTHFLTLNSGDSILLDANGETVTGYGQNSSATFTAPNLVEVRNADLSSFGVVNMAANTINLTDVAFGAGSSVTLASQNGVLAPNPNTGAESVPGDVNFISGVTYGGQPAQDFINPANGHGITITTLH